MCCYMPLSLPSWVVCCLAFRVAAVRPVSPMVLLVSSSSSRNLRHSLLPRDKARAHLRGASLPLIGTFRTGASWKVVGLRFDDVLELGVRSSNVSLITLPVLRLLVALSDCILSRYLGGLFVITSNL